MKKQKMRKMQQQPIIKKGEALCPTLNVFTTE